ncbi:hypothetical protein [Pseudooceanicola sp.]|uniref:hypothetical protein n=1 Tax=Pseudooceanicola sp. TaxID=1914328 RepID=UPI002626D257|nr:hypothetical protein [Pseudooceanicola sp.]MDF1855268.1 hypothetical protein [Pseudooceanicola sp.]
MSRLILIIVLISALVAAASLVAAAWGRPAGAETVPVRRSNAIQKVAFVLLMVVMGGVATGWLGAD